MILTLVIVSKCPVLYYVLSQHSLRLHEEKIRCDHHYCCLQFSNNQVHTTYLEKGEESNVFKNSLSYLCVKWIKL